MAVGAGSKNDMEGQNLNDHIGRKHEREEVK